MDKDTRIFSLPQDASTIASQTDHLYLFLWAVTLFFAVLIAGLIVFFAWKYRRRRDDEVPPFTHGDMRLELAWTVIPLGIVMVIFVWGAKLYIHMSRIPEDAMQIDVVGKQWMWKVQHPTGRREINELHVPAGRRVKLAMISQDVIHSFFLPNFRIKQDVLPGRYTYQWFEATEPGEYHLFCAEYCGTNHSRMVGKVVVMEPAHYAAWLSNTVPDEPPALAGEKLFIQYGCVACHGQQGPTLAGLWGRKDYRVLVDGKPQAVTVDDDYLRESILNPAAKILEGFPPIMPSFRGQLTEEQIGQLIAYIKSLGGAQQPGGPPRNSGGADVLFGAPRRDAEPSVVTPTPATGPSTRQAQP